MAIKEDERQQFNQQLKAAAFTAWRFEVALSSLLGGQAKKPSYPDYVEMMGLATEKEKKQNAALKKIQALQAKFVAKEAEERANKIIEIDKANRAKMKGGNKTNGNGNI